jgi:hypothetical protein
MAKMNRAKEERRTKAAWKVGPVAEFLDLLA